MSVLVFVSFTALFVLVFMTTFAPLFGLINVLFFHRRLIPYIFKKIRKKNSLSLLLKKANDGSGNCRDHSFV